MKFHGLRRAVLVTLGALSALAFAEGNEATFVTGEGPGGPGPHHHAWVSNAPLNENTFYLSVPTQGMCSTDVKEIGLCDSHFFLNVGQQKTFYFDRRFLVRSIVVHAESNGYGAAGFAVVVNGVSSAKMIAPPADPRYEIPINQEASEISLINTGTDNSQAWLKVQRVLVKVSPIDNTGRECRVRQADFVCRDCAGGPGRGVGIREWEQEARNWDIPVFYRSPVARMAHVVSRTLDELDSHFDYDEKSCFVKPLKSAALATIGRAEGLSDAASVAQPYFQDLLQELDCADPFLMDFSGRRIAEGRVQRIITTREALRKELMLKDNICPIRTLIKRLEKGCIDKDYIEKIERRQDLFQEWFKDRAEDAARVERDQERLKELMRQLDEDEGGPRRPKRGVR